jgi:hypothetical protein
VNVEYGQHDQARPIVLWGWDGRSQPIYVYEDELELPDFRRVHIVKVEREPAF